MDRKRLRDILCACAIMLMLPCSAYIIRGMSMPYVRLVQTGFPQDTVPKGGDSLNTADSTVMLPDSTALLPDSLLSGIDTTGMADSTASADTASGTKEYEPWELREMARDSARRVRDSLKGIRDSIRWSKPRVLETGFVPDSLYYKRILSWNTGPYINEYRHMHMDTTFNDWFTEYPFYKEDLDAVYLGTVGSAVQNVNFFRRRELDRFKAYAPYITYSHVPENMPFYNVKAPYTELAYWGTIFAFKDKEETNVRFLHTQNITPELNLAVLYQGWKALGMLENEKTVNNSLEVSANYLGRNYIAHAGLIHHNITRQENGGIQDSYMVRDTTVDAKTIAVNLQEAQNKLSRNTFFIDHSYNIHLESKSRRLRKAMEEDSVLAAAVDSIVALRMQRYAEAVDAAVEAARMPADTGAADSTAAGGQLPAPADSAAVPALADSLMAQAADSLLRASVMDTLLPPSEDEIYTALADSLLFGSAGEGPMLSVGHVGEVTRYYRYYTDNIALNDEVGRNFYNNMFYINPTSSADSTRMLTVDNKLFFRLQPWARDAVVSQISGGLGYQWNSIYAFNPDMFLTGNGNRSLHDLYVYAGARGQYRKYLNWGAQARYSFLGYWQNDFSVDADLDVSFYPFKDKSEPIVLGGKFSTSLKEPDWFSQHYYSNHYVWDNDFGKTSTTKVEAFLDIPKWRLEASFSYGLVNNYLYNDTLGVIRQHDGLINVMSGYVRKDFKLWKFHLDNKILFQYSSNRDVLPLPMLTFHMRYYLELEAVRNVLTVQIGADATMNTPYYAPAYNPALGTFQLQTRELIGYNPYIDVFLNMQWKRVNVFIKVINVGQGWPDGGNMFSAYHYIKPYRGFKVGIHWPFYIE
ncbi:MAG TPA: putative porin [Candidatus Coprenecus avistercoris]|uniref:Porin n=1 Tax=Candidatus Coprenecus avistercoris TaxID=2840730 RepID=A0A9D1E0B4_9BACT|nr:putative porin [Candidatus Coprenecus avistercoris]